MSLEIRTRDNAITGWSRVDPQDDTSPVAAVAQITWWLYPDRWHINFLRAEQPRHLLPMLAAFRSLWKASGRPIITFRTTDDNRQMQRLARTLRARRAGLFYTVESLPVISMTATKDDYHGRTDRSIAEGQAEEDLGDQGGRRLRA